MDTPIHNFPCTIYENHLDRNICIYMHIIGKCYYDYYILKYNFPFKFTLFGGVSRRKKNESNYILEFLFPKLMFYPQ